MQRQGDAREAIGIRPDEGIPNRHAIPVRIDAAEDGRLPCGPGDEVAGELNRVSEADGGGASATGELHFENAVGDVGQITGCGQAVGGRGRDGLRVVEERIQVEGELREVVRPVEIGVCVGCIVTGRQAAC